MKSQSQEDIDINVFDEVDKILKDQEMEEIRQHQKLYAYLDNPNYGSYAGKEF
jgi:hypothetical protein